MTKGRKPKPTHLKIVSGTDQPCRMNPDEPKPKKDKVKMPPGLTPKAQKQWKYIVKELVDCGVMTNLDVHALRLYCEAWARYSDAAELLQKSSLITKTPNGLLMQNPVIPIMNKAFEQMMRILPEFGATPASRTKVSRVETEKDADPWDAL